MTFHATKSLEFTLNGKPAKSVKVRNAADPDGPIIDIAYALAPDVADKYHAAICAGRLKRQGLWCKLVGHKPLAMQTYGDWCWDCLGPK